MTSIIIPTDDKRVTGQPATAAFAARVAFIHSVSHGARTLDVIRQSARKVPTAPAAIQSCSADKSAKKRMTADSAPGTGLVILAAIFTVGFIGEDSRPQLLSTFALVAVLAVGCWLSHRSRRTLAAVKSSDSEKQPALID